VCGVTADNDADADADVDGTESCALAAEARC